MSDFVKKYRYYLVGGLVVTAVLLFVINKGARQESVHATATVMRGDVSNRVLVFGKAQPSEIFNLSFDVGGKLTVYPYQEGEHVSKGVTVAKLDGRTVAADINRARTTIGIEQSRLSELSAPISTEDQQIQQSRIEKQELQTMGILQDFQNGMDNTIEDFYDLVESEIDTYYVYPTDPRRTVFRLKEADRISENTRQAMVDSRVLLEVGYVALLQNANPYDQYQEFASLVDFSVQLAESISALLDNETTVAAEQIQDDLEMFTEDVTDLYDGLNTSYTAWQTAEEELEVLQNQLEADLAGADDTTLDYQRSVIASREAELSSLYTDLSRLTLTSPVSGVVFDAPLTNYQTVSPGETVVSVVLDEPLVVKANVAEADVAYIGPGNTVVVTFDALPNQEFVATVAGVNNRENIGEVIPVYETTFVFDNGQNIESVRSGMTANIEVISGNREGVLYVPARFVKRTKEGYEVLVQDKKGDIQTRPVGVGLWANTGTVEVISGLEEGDTVVIVK